MTSPKALRSASFHLTSALVVALAGAVVAACSTPNSEEPADASGGKGGTGGSGGTVATGGTGGAGTAGTTGNSGGSSGSGGSAGSSGGGGVGGSAGSTGGSGGGSGSPADAGADVGTDAPADGPSVDGPVAGGPTLDQCFASIRMAQGQGQVSTKASADGTVKMRIALETADRFGTAGTTPWEPIRFALETPDTRVCLTSEADLATDYQDGHHNCNDVMTFTSGNRRYEIQHPDTAAMRNEATLTVYEGTSVVLGPLKLTTTTCTTTVASGVCRSGGPC